MAHFAKISETNEVLTVLVVDNSELLNADGVEDETVGQQYLETHNNWPAHLWIQTSYNTSSGKHYTVTIDSEGNQTSSESADQSKALRGNYAGVGCTWDLENEIFWLKKPYASWVKHIESASWKSPIGDTPELTVEQITHESNNYRYEWNESDQSWDLEIWNNLDESWDLVTTPIVS
jgi:hypothetical protein|tara:strand:+ start:946 stop:1476 length:531 start_codon:yes stop_codon:yes gene_type:complete